ncbi:hypothetical protein [Aliiglaciecola lipolytica]|uniref:Uncharacterized protein n=1 Tax=Aliiglaciecola lipolytica E3 TaxID=1127673 RepID=K6XPN6_9ALTE|nr:hypothetical protein [Aliiglaciecola lipolytica]GAC13646.1 hypothetical protein GLIP_1004 [Aliiglaciecola lipolytica E3]
MKSPLLLIVSAVLFFAAGYWFGSYQTDDSPTKEISKLIIEVDSDEKLPALPDVSENAETSQDIEIEIVSTKDLSEETLSDLNKTHPLAELGDAFQQSKHARTQTDKKKREFEQSFSANDANLTAQNQISDFLALHKNADLIELHQLDCDNSRCQLIGEYAGEHQEWGKVISAMREMDWWDYSGTSSSSTSKNGKTYFHVFLDQ